MAHDLQNFPKQRKELWVWFLNLQYTLERWYPLGLGRKWELRINKCLYKEDISKTLTIKFIVLTIA